MSSKTSVLRGPRQVMSKSRQVLRTMTTGTALCTVPAGSRLLGIIISGAASNAGTTATLQFGTNVTSTDLTAAENVLAAGKGNGGFIGIDAAQRPLGDDTKIYVIYAETGTASDAGSWTATVLYTEGAAADEDQ